MSGSLNDYYLPFFDLDVDEFTEILLDLQSHDPHSLRESFNLEYLNELQYS